MSEDFADSVSDQIQSLEIGQLLAVCEQFNVVVSDDKKDKRGAVIRLLNKFVEEKLEADDEDALRQVHGELGKMLKSKVKSKENDQQLDGNSASAVEKDDVKQVVDVKDGSSSSTKTQQHEGATGGSDVGDLVRQKVDLLRGCDPETLKLTVQLDVGLDALTTRTCSFRLKKGRVQVTTLRKSKMGSLKPLRQGPACISISRIRMTSRRLNSWGCCIATTCSMFKTHPPFLTRWSVRRRNRMRKHSIMLSVCWKCVRV